MQSPREHSIASAADSLCGKDREHFMSAFDQLGLSEPLLRAVHASGYETATPIQLQAIPAGSFGPRPDGLCPNGHRQNGGVCSADAPPTEHQREPGSRQRLGAKTKTKRQVARFVSAGRSSANSDVDPRPNARAGRADWPKFQDLRPFHWAAIHRASTAASDRARRCVLCRMASMCWSPRRVDYST